MTEVLHQMFETPDVRCFTTATHAMAALDVDLQTCAALCLDGDLSRSIHLSHGEYRHPGSGRQVAEYLVRVGAQFPVIVHSSNTEKAVGMLMALHEGGRWCDRVIPTKHHWIERCWQKTLHRLLHPIPNDELSEADLPGRDADCAEMFDFAATYDPRLDWDNLEKAQFVATQQQTLYQNRSSLPQTLAELRVCLWAERLLWLSHDLDPDDASTAYIDALLEALRSTLQAKPPRLSLPPVDLSGGDEFADRVAGVLFGQAIGDALGLGMEGLSPQQVAQYYPEGLQDYDAIVRDEHRSRWEPGEWTDDTGLMLCILDSFLEQNAVDLLDIARRFQRWAAAGNPGLGGTTHAVLFCKDLYGVEFLQSDFEDNYGVAARHVWEQSDRQLAANGGVMRTSVVGLWDSGDRQAVRENAAKICQITHYDPRCVASSVAVSLAVRDLLNGATDMQALTRSRLGEFDGIHADVTTYRQRTENPDIAALKLGESWGMGYTLKTTSAGFWALQHAPDFESGLLQIIHQGGDADTNGAVAGALLGAKFGYRNMPEAWVQGLRDRAALEARAEQLVRRWR